MRTIGYAGDSTDGEDYEEDVDENPPKGTKSRRVALIEKLNKYKDFEYQYNNTKYQDFNYGNSCVLKEIGQQLLQSKTVRSKYKVQKQKFIPELTDEQQSNLQRLDKLIGASYGTVVCNYEADEEILKHRASDFFIINQKIINDTCGQQKHYKNYKNNSDKANFYIKHNVKKADLNSIYTLNKTIELYAQDQRQDLEPKFTKRQDTKNDASLFLAQIKATKKLDKLLGINCIYDYRFGTEKHITVSSITKRTTHKNETLEIHTLGAFSDYITDEGAYDAIGRRLKRFINKAYINKNKLSEFFKSSLRGEAYKDIILNSELEDELTNQLHTLVKLMFGIEVKRNSASLLTNAMFFDLVDANIYEIEDISYKMPMAMQGAVSASTTIDKAIKDKTKIIKTSGYDCRGKFEPAKARDLANRDNKILQDWLKWQLESAIDTAADDVRGIDSIRTLNNCFKDLHITVYGQGEGKVINKLPLLLRPNHNAFEVTLHWNTAKSKIKSKVSDVQKVKAKVFFELIKNWYGIELSFLNKDDFILLKAAAEPHNPTPDRDDQGSTIISTTDKNEVNKVIETISKIKVVSKHKQEYVIDHSKAQLVLQKVGFNKTVQENALHEIWHGGTCRPSKDFVQKLGALIFDDHTLCTTESVMSGLETVYHVLKNNEKDIKTYRLNLKDPNKHHADNNVLSMDDLFYEFLDSVNKRALAASGENNILDAVDCYYHQEQINTLGSLPPL